MCQGIVLCFLCRTLGCPEETGRRLFDYIRTTPEFDHNPLPLMRPCQFPPPNRCILGMENRPGFANIEYIRRYGMRGISLPAFALPQNAFRYASYVVDLATIPYRQRREIMLDPYPPAEYCKKCFAHANGRGNLEDDEPPDEDVPPSMDGDSDHWEQPRWSGLVDCGPPPGQGRRGRRLQDNGNTYNDVNGALQHDAGTFGLKRSNILSKRRHKVSDWMQTVTRNAEEPCATNHDDYNSILQDAVDAASRLTTNEAEPEFATDTLEALQVTPTLQAIDEHNKQVQQPPQDHTTTVWAAGLTTSIIDGPPKIGSLLFECNHKSPEYCNCCQGQDDNATGTPQQATEPSADATTEIGRLMISDTATTLQSISTHPIKNEPDELALIEQALTVGTITDEASTETSLSSETSMSTTSQQSDDDLLLRGGAGSDRLALGKRWFKSKFQAMSPYFPGLEPVPEGLRSLAYGEDGQSPRPEGYRRLKAGVRRICERLGFKEKNENDANAGNGENIENAENGL